MYVHLTKILGQSLRLPSTRESGPPPLSISLSNLLSHEDLGKDNKKKEAQSIGSLPLSALTTASGSSLEPLILLVSTPRSRLSLLSLALKKA